MQASEKSLISRLPTAIILVAAFSGFVLRFSQLGTKSLQFDEGYTAWVVSLSPVQIIRVIRVDTSPPLYYLLLHCWMVIFGHSEAAMRLLSAVFSSAALIVFYQIALRVLRDRWAVAAAMCLAAVSCMSIAYAHEARFYSLMVLLVAIDFYLLLLNAERPSKRRLALMAVYWTAGLYVSSIMGFYVAAMALASLILQGQTPLRRRFVDISIVTAITAVAFLPWLPTTLAQARAIQGHFWASPPDWWDLARTISELSGVTEHAAPLAEKKLLVLLEAGLLCVILAGLLDRGNRRVAAALVIVGLGPILLIFVQSQVSQPIFIDRAFLPATLFMPLLIVAPLKEVTVQWQRWLYGVVAVVMVILSIRSIGPMRLGAHSEPWREMCAVVSNYRSDRPLMVFSAEEGELLYDYYVRHGDYSPAPNLLGVPIGFFGTDPPRAMRRVRSDADLDRLRTALAEGGFHEVVLFESHPWWADAAHRVPDFLGLQLRLIDKRGYRDAVIYRYSFDR